MFHQKTLHKTWCEWVHCFDKAANHQLPIAAAFWIIWIFSRGMFKLNAKFDKDSLLYSLSYFECDGHTVHVFTQRCVPPLLTSTVKLSLFKHALSSPLSLAARLHQCCSNHSHYINNGWAFSRQTSSIELVSTSLAKSTYSNNLFIDSFIFPSLNNDSYISSFLIFTLFFPWISLEF